MNFVKVEKDAWVDEEEDSDDDESDDGESEDEDDDSNNENGGGKSITVAPRPYNFRGPRREIRA